MYKAALRIDTPHAPSSSVALPSSSNDDDGTHVKFRDAQELSEWMKTATLPNLQRSPCRKRKKYYSDDVMAFMDECEPAMSDLYADIKDAYQGYGFLSRDDFAGFVKKVFQDNMRISSATESSESDVDDQSAAVAKKNATRPIIPLS